jgi:hypothetical protein
MQGGSSPHSSAGTGLHAAIEWHEQNRIDGLDTPELWELLWKAADEAYTDGENIPSDFAAIHGGPDIAAQWACGLTVCWHDSPIRERLLTYTPLAVEPHIETENIPGPNTLRGYLDWVGRDDNGVLTVIDYKSASGLARWNNPDHHLLEAAVYLYLVSTSEYWTGDEPIRMEWHVVSRKDDTRILEGPTFDASIVDFVYDRLSEAQAIVDGNMFTPNPSWGLCSNRWCTFYHGCQTTGILGPDNVDFSVASRRAASLPAPDAGATGTP